MEKKIEEVNSIVIQQDELLIYHGTPIPKRFKRGEWKLITEDMIRLEDSEVRSPWTIPYASSVINMRPGIGVSCQILEDKKIILCGERPEEMFID